MQRRFRITLTEAVEVTETITILVEGRAAQKERETTERAVEAQQPPAGQNHSHRPYRFYKRKTRKRPKSI